jgi:hypothetical protein
MVASAVALLAGCGDGASQQEVARLEARVTQLEQRVRSLEDETTAVRAVERRLAAVEQFVASAKDKLPDIDRLRELLQRVTDALGL